MKKLALLFSILIFVGTSFAQTQVNVPKKDLVTFTSACKILATDASVKLKSKDYGNVFFQNTKSGPVIIMGERYIIEVKNGVAYGQNPNRRGSDVMTKEQVQAALEWTAKNVRTFYKSYDIK